MNNLRFWWWMIVHPREAEKAIVAAGEWASQILAAMRRKDGFTLIELLIVLAIVCSTVNIVLCVVLLLIRAA